MNCDSKLELPEKILLSTKKQAQNESLLILRNYNNELADEHKKKEEYLRTLKHEKSEKECKIKSLLCSIGIKHQEIQKEKHESEFDCTIENDWKKRVELIQKKRITSLQEYQNKMAEFRKELFSSISFNDDVITQEINDIEHKQEILQSNIHNVEIILQEMEKTLFILDTEIEIEKENTNLLIENLENAKYSNEIELQKLGIGVPASNLPTIQSVTWGYVIKTNYALPTNISQYGNVQRHTKRSAGISRWDFYRSIADVINRSGMKGEECIKRSICETSQVKFSTRDIIGEFLHILLLPSSTKDYESEYYNAELIGLDKRNNCAVIYKKCPFSLLELFSVIQAERNKSIYLM